MQRGRNDPCDCGSGKKYKKCCLGKAEASASDRKTDGKATRDWSGSVHPYHLARMLANPDALNTLSLTKKQLSRLVNRWTVAKMATLETEQIVRHLSELGIDAKREVFRTFAKEEMSAWNISERWLQSMDFPPKDNDEDFVGFAACELWKRYIPERPSMEMVDDWVQEGYDLEEEGKLEEAFGNWQRVWSRMLELFTPEMRTLNSVEPVFKISHFFFNWIQDYEMCLDNLIADDDSWLKTGIPFLEKVMLQFSEEKQVIHFHCDQGRWLIQDGRVQEGVAILEGIISSQPDRADGYVALLTAQNQSQEAYLDTKDAIEVLKRAMTACPQEEREAWDIEVRLAQLVKKGRS